MARRVGRGVTTHRVQRSLAHLTLGTARAMEQRQERQAELAAGETEQQYKVAVGGTAGSDAMDWQETSIEFADSFYPGQDRRDSSFDTPLFTYGVEMQSPTPVILSVVVTGWLTDPDGTVRGVRLALGAHVIGAVDDVKFDAIAHLNFQGWAAPALNDDIEA
jgi:hypothetical protein